MAEAANRNFNAVVVVAPMALDLEIDSRYRCCCNCMHVKTGAIIIGILDVLDTWSMSSSVNEWVAGTLSVLSIIIVCFMFYGICTLNHLLVIPYLVWQVVKMVIFVVISIVYLTTVIFVGKLSTEVRVEVDGRKVDPEDDAPRQIAQRLTPRTFFSYLLWFGFHLAIHVWFFLVIRRLHKYIIDKRAKMFPGVALAAVGVVPGPDAVAPAPPVLASPPGPKGAGPAGATTSASTDPDNAV